MTDGHNHTTATMSVFLSSRADPAKLSGRKGLLELISRDQTFFLDVQDDKLLSEAPPTFDLGVLCCVCHLSGMSHVFW